jgi:hypothetical protein
MKVIQFDKSVIGQANRKLDVIRSGAEIPELKRGQTITLTLSGATNTRWGMAYAFFDWNQDNAWT